MGINEVPGIIREIYSLVHRLEGLFEGRHFTPDGHMVGSLGEVIVSHYYGLDLMPASCPGYDAISPDGKQVQIKATQAKSVAMRSDVEHLIVIRILKDGSFEGIFNGPGDIVWEQTGKMQSNGQRAISLTKLKKLQKQVRESDRVPMVK